MKKAAKRTTKTTPATAGNTWDIQEKFLKELERGITYLHKQNYAEALERFKDIAVSTPQARELQDRLRTYMRICERMMERKPAQPKREDHFYAGVIKANEAAYDEAVEHLNRALETSPKDEKVHYVLASTLALKGERQAALKHLQEAIELNATNRAHALNDPDFEPIRDEEGFQNLVHPDET